MALSFAGSLFVSLTTEDELDHVGSIYLTEDGDALAQEAHVCFITHMLDFDDL